MKGDLDSGIRETFACASEYGKFVLSEYWKSKSWFLESGIQLKESGIPLTTGILNPGSTDKKSRIHSLESGVHSVESRI